MDNEQEPKLADAGLIKVLLAYPNKRASQMAVYSSLLTPEVLEKIKKIMQDDGQ
jgi:hypothetical protein